MHLGAGFPVDVDGTLELVRAALVAQVASRRARTVLFVGAGRHQRRAILRAKELGLRVAAVDRNPDALGLQEADIAKVVDFSDVDAVLKATARIKLDGVLTVSADRAVPVVAAVAEARGLPGIGTRDRAPDDAQGRDARAGSPTPACRSRASRRCARSPSAGARPTRSASRRC